MATTTVTPVGGSWIDATFDAVASHARSLRITGHVIWALMLRSFREQYGHRRLGLLWAFIPPLFSVAFLVSVFALVRQDTTPIGHDVAPFIALGLLNLHFFTGVMQGVAASATSSKGLLIFPRVKVLDLYLARYLLEVSVLLVVFTTFMAGFIIFGLIPPPDELDRVLLPLFIGSVLGLGMGFVHAVMRTVVMWDMFWRIVNRVMFFTSGLFFIADGMPAAFRRLLYYNPVLHLCEWLRSGYYANYESRFYDPMYPIGFALAALILGLAMERVFRKRILTYRRRP